MAAHRYWRAVGLEAYGAGDLELSCFHLLAAGVRVDDTATLTSNIAPATGALAALQDDDLTTFARWSAASVQSIALQWDFGAGGAEVNDIRLAANSEWRFPLMLKLQWSDDAVAWTDYYVFAGIAYPGVGVPTSSGRATPYADAVLLDTPDGYWKLSEGSGPFIDLGTGHSSSALVGSPLKGQPALLPEDSGSLKFVESGGLNTAALAGYTGSVTYECIVKLDTLANGPCLLSDSATSSGSYFGVVLIITSSGELSANVITTSGSAQQHTAVSAKGAIVVGETYHLALRWDEGASLKAYINGDEVGSKLTSATSTRTDGGAFRINGFIGTTPGTYCISNVAVYAKALPPERIAEHARVFSQAYTAGRVLLNKIRGRAASKSPLTLATGPVMSYGIPKVSPPVYLGIESGSVKDLQTGVLGQGIGRVRATVKLKNTPVNTPLKRRVRLIRECDGLQVRETWSDPVTGIYDFTYIDELQTWTVVSYDYAHDKRAVIADGLSLANGGVRLMP